MRISTIIGTVVLTGATLALTAALPVQDAGGQAGQPQEGAPDMAAMMEAYAKAATPGEQHAQMMQMAGTWDTVMSHHATPDMSPTESKGTSRFEAALGGRYLIEHFSSEMPMMGSFQGMGVHAFDNINHEYVSTWIDSFSTGIMVTRGTALADGSIEMRGEYDDALGQGKIPVRQVAKQVSPDEHHFTMWETRGGAEQLVFELVYTRAAAEEPGGMR